MKKSTLLSFAVLCLSLQMTYAQKSKKEDKQPLDTIKLDGLKWRHIGPSLTSGRISDIVVFGKPSIQELSTPQFLMLKARFL